MALKRFEFTRNWTNPDDFPPVVSEEAQVRTDMQSLHDEAKNGINALINELEASTAAANLGAKDKSGVSSTVQNELNKLTGDQHSHGNKNLLDSYDQTNVDLKNAVSKAHNHSNSSVLDSCTAAFTTALKSAYGRLVTLFEGVTSITTTLGADHTTVPTSKAVSDAIAQSGSLPAGGSTGYALLKVSSKNYDMEWGPVNAEAIGAVPIDGSKAMTGPLTTEGGGTQGEFAVEAPCAYLNVYEKADWDKRRTLMLSTRQNSPDLTKALVLGSLDDGTWREYYVLHTGNKSLIAPEDIGAATTKTYTATVSTGWTKSGSYFYKDVTVSGILATDNPIVDINPGTDNAANVLYSKAICKVFRITTSANSIRLWATENIATAFPIQLKVVR